MTIFIEISNDLYDPKAFADGPTAAYIASPYEARFAIKELPTRRWNTIRKRWVIPATDVDLAVATLSQLGYHVRVLNPSKHQGSASRQRETARTWADEMFTALPERFHVPIYTALTKILHPDIGGDLTAMQALNIARDRAQGAA